MKWQKLQHLRSIGKGNQEAWNRKIGNKSPLRRKNLCQEMKLERKSIHWQNTLGFKMNGLWWDL